MSSPTTPEENEKAPVRETFVDYLVKKAKAEGAFENLPGEGQPIADLDQPYDELWWAKKLVEREELKQIFRER